MKISIYANRELYCGMNEHSYERTEKSIKLVSYETKRHRDIVDIVINQNIEQLSDYYKQLELVIENEF